MKTLLKIIGFTAVACMFFLLIKHNYFIKRGTYAVLGLEEKFQSLKEGEYLNINQLTNFEWDKLKWYYNDSGGSFALGEYYWEFFKDQKSLLKVDLNIKALLFSGSYNCGCKLNLDKEGISGCFSSKNAEFKVVSSYNHLFLEVVNC